MLIGSTVEEPVTNTSPSASSTSPPAGASLPGGSLPSAVVAAVGRLGSAGLGRLGAASGGGLGRAGRRRGLAARVVVVTATGGEDEVPASGRCQGAAPDGIAVHAVELRFVVRVEPSAGSDADRRQRR